MLQLSYSARAMEPQRYLEQSNLLIHLVVSAALMLARLICRSQPLVLTAEQQERPKPVIVRSAYRTRSEHKPVCPFVLML